MIETMGDRLKKLRLKSKLSMNELAIKINTTKSNISKYENNLRQPGSEILAKLAKCFHVSADYLIFGSEKNTFIESSLVNILNQHNINVEMNDELEDILEIFDKAVEIYCIGRNSK